MSDVDDMNHIRIFAVTGTCGQGDWQCIGYFGKQHIAAFGFSPQDALEKAMSKITPAVGPKDETNLEDMF
jgi:hypothetical protein